MITPYASLLKGRMAARQTDAVPDIKKIPISKSSYGCVGSRKSEEAKAFL